MAWTLLFLAGLFEVAWAIGLKYTDGFSKLVPSTLTVGVLQADRPGDFEQASEKK